MEALRDLVKQDNQHPVPGLAYVEFDVHVRAQPHPPLVWPSQLWHSIPSLPISCLVRTSQAWATAGVLNVSSAPCSIFYAARSRPGGPAAMQPRRRSLALLTTC